MKYNKVLIDGDLILRTTLYSTMVYDLQCEDLSIECDGLIDARAKWKDNEYADLVKTEIIKGFPFYCHVLKNRLNSILDELEHKEYIIGVSSNEPGWKVNKRYQIARTRPYNDGRGEKPEHYLRLKQYMVDNFNCEIVSEGEVDDWLGYNQEDGNIVVTIDKDNYQVPGKYFDFRDSSIITSSDPGSIFIKESCKSKPILGTGFIWFCVQTLMGDSVDSIQGCPGFGKTSAIKRFSEVKSEEEAWEIVKEEYMSAKKLKDHTVEERMALMEENARLVWIPRHYDELYSPTLKGKRLFD